MKSTQPNRKSDRGMLPLRSPRNAYMDIHDALRLLHQVIDRLPIQELLKKHAYSQWPRDVLRAQVSLHFVNSAYIPKGHEVSVYEIDLCLAAITKTYEEECVMCAQAINRAFIRHIVFTHRSENAVSQTIIKCQKFVLNILPRRR